jgi:hypothetical protein
MPAETTWWLPHQVRKSSSRTDSSPTTAGEFGLQVIVVAEYDDPPSGLKVTTKDNPRVSRALPARSIRYNAVFVRRDHPVQRREHRKLTRRPDQLLQRHVDQVDRRLLWLDSTSKRSEFDRLKAPTKAASLGKFKLRLAHLQALDERDRAVAGDPAGPARCGRQRPESFAALALPIGSMLRFRYRVPYEGLST